MLCSHVASWEKCGMGTIISYIERYLNGHEKMEEEGEYQTF